MLRGATGVSSFNSPVPALQPLIGATLLCWRLHSPRTKDTPRADRGANPKGLLGKDALLTTTEKLELRLVLGSRNSHWLRFPCMVEAATSVLLGCLVQSTKVLYDDRYIRKHKCLTQIADLQMYHSTRRKSRAGWRLLSGQGHLLLLWRTQVGLLYIHGSSQLSITSSSSPPRVLDTHGAHTSKLTQNEIRNLKRRNPNVYWTLNHSMWQSKRKCCIYNDFE